MCVPLTQLRAVPPLLRAVSVALTIAPPRFNLMITPEVAIRWRVPPDLRDRRATVTSPRLDGDEELRVNGDTEIGHARAHDEPMYPHAERLEQQVVSSTDRVGLRSWRHAQDIPRRQRAIPEQRRHHPEGAGIPHGLAVNLRVDVPRRVEKTAHARAKFDLVATMERRSLGHRALDGDDRDDQA